MNSLLGQDDPLFLSENATLTPSEKVCLCKPGLANTSRSRGLELSFGQFGNSRFQDDNTTDANSFKLQQINFKLRFPIVNKPGLKVIGGISYRPEKYYFNATRSDAQPIFDFIDIKTLKSSGFGLFVSKSLSDKYYTVLSLRTRFNSTYDGIVNFDNRYAIYQAAALFGIKKNKDKEIAFGINFRHSFRNTRVVPVLIYNQTFNKNWGIESVLPSNVKLRYNMNEQSLAYFELRYNSQSYAINTNEELPYNYNLNHSELRGAFTLEKKLFSWIWLDLTGGVQYNFAYNVDC